LGKSVRATLSVQQLEDPEPSHARSTASTAAKADVDVASTRARDGANSAAGCMRSSLNAQTVRPASTPVKRPPAIAVAAARATAIGVTGATRASKPAGLDA
jgi:hypothetical protein